MGRLLVLVLVVTVGCAGASAGGEGGSGGGGTGGTGGKFTGPLPEDLAAVFDTPADPVHVTATADTERAAQAVLDEEGGSLSATGADGTRFELRIPSGALLAPTRITMTPVASLEGLPFGESPEAVVLEPDGLVLYELATLTIHTPAPLPVDEQILVGWRGGGEDLILAPPEPGTSEAAIRLWHFSGWGVAKGLRADPESVRARLGGATESRIQNAIASYLAAERDKALASGNGSTHTIAELLAMMDEYMEKVVKPRLEAIPDGCAEARLAVQTVTGAWRQYGLLGAEVGSTGELVDLVQQAELVCVREEYEICVNDHVIHRMLPAYLAMERNVRLGGVEGSTRDLAAAAELVKKCLRFEVKFDSDARLDDGDGGGYDSTVTATAKLEMGSVGPPLFLPATTALANTDFVFRSPGCNVTSNRGGGDYLVLGLKWRGESLDAPLVDQIYLTHMPGATTESYVVQCPDSDPYTSPPEPLWFAVFATLHQHELDTMTGGFRVDDWDIQGGELYATSRWMNSDIGDGTTETGELQLFHTPAP